MAEHFIEYFTHVPLDRVKFDLANRRDTGKIISNSERLISKSSKLGRRYGTIV